MLRLLTAALCAYGDMYGAYPAGDNAAILRQLTGDNPRKTVFLAGLTPYKDSKWPPSAAMDAEKRVVDGWNTPFQFEFGLVNRLVSAGRDKRFGTPDDFLQFFPAPGGKRKK